MQKAKARVLAQRIHLPSGFVLAMIGLVILAAVPAQTNSTQMTDVLQWSDAWGDAASQ